MTAGPTSGNGAFDRRDDRRGVAAPRPSTATAVAAPLRQICLATTRTPLLRCEKTRVGRTAYAMPRGCRAMEPRTARPQQTLSTCGRLRASMLALVAIGCAAPQTDRALASYDSRRCESRLRPKASAGEREAHHVHTDVVSRAPRSSSFMAANAMPVDLDSRHHPRSPGGLRCKTANFAGARSSYAARSRRAISSLRSSASEASRRGAWRPSRRPAESAPSSRSRWRRLRHSRRSTCAARRL